jgi:hypothetical protein
MLVVSSEGNTESCISRREVETNLRGHHMGALIILALSLSLGASAQTSRSDFNTDGAVDFTDFLLFVEVFGTTSATHDLDGNGSVGFEDFLLFVEDFSAENTPPVSSATYRVTFESTWSASTHPSDFPQEGLAHFSPLVGATHNADAVFWASGSAATEGIKQMAEGGQTGALSGEVNTAISGGSAALVLLGLDLDPTPGSTSFTFDIDENHPLVTLVTMIAPSPDWFVGVSGVDLFEGGEWVSEVSFDLMPWDAGTDSGTSYTAEDQATNPPATIRAISGSPFSSQPLGSFTFTKE